MKTFNSNLEQWIKNNIELSVVKFQVTGAAYLADKSNNYLMSNMLLSLVIAFVVVSTVMMMMFKSIKMFIVSLIPNIIPLAFAGGMMGYANIEMNGPLSMIFTVGFVIAVDNSIHFLSKFKFEWKSGKSIEQAVHITFRETGKAIVITSLILFFGFVVLLHSHIKEVFYQGALIGIMLFVALIADLFVLPALLIKFFKTDDKILQSPTIHRNGF